MPAPEKRKYHRIHIAYLIMILTMKQSLSISDVQKILPADSNETDVRAVYEDYSLKFRRVGLFFNQQVQSGSEGIRSANEQNGNNAVELLVIESALIAGFSKILAASAISHAIESLDDCFGLKLFIDLKSYPPEVYVK